MVAFYSMLNYINFSCLAKGNQNSILYSRILLKNCFFFTCIFPARMVPFYYVPRNLCYSVFWPIKDLQKNGNHSLNNNDKLNNNDNDNYY